MMRIALGVVLSLAAVAAAGAAATQPPPAAAPTPAGHWQGAIETPGTKLEIAVDLRPKGDAWEGVITIQSQNVKGYPLTSLAVNGSDVSFAMNTPGNPSFAGKLDAAGNVLSGDFSQGGATLPFSLSRAGEAKFEPVVPSAAIDKALEGSWEGALSAGGKTLRLVLKLANGTDERATGSIVSVDQGGVEIPIQTVAQSAGQAGPHLELLLPTIAASYKADLKDNQLSGTWSQAAGSAPLVFKRAAK
jgi:hypothetical protein